MTRRIRASVRPLLLAVACATGLIGRAAASGPEPIYAAIVVDAASGQVLHEVNADIPSYPASLTKMMTLYMLFQTLDARRVSLDSRLPISEECIARPPSKLGLRLGQSLRVEDAIFALVTKSANDAACTVAEFLGGTEPDFADYMTRRAQELGMSRTVFRNASGLPDWDQVSTVRDMARLSLALLRDFPHYYHYFSTRNFQYGRKSHRNHNGMLENYDGVDGIKTGYVQASGFNLAASAVRGGRRLVAVVFGGRSPFQRNQHMTDLLDAGFIRATQDVDAQVQTASAPRLPVESPDTWVRRVYGQDPGPQGTGAGRPAGWAPVDEEQAEVDAFVLTPAERKELDRRRAQRVQEARLAAERSAALAREEEEHRRQAAARRPGADRDVARGGPSTTPEPEDREGVALERSWGIQVGAYAGQRAARVAVTNAARNVAHILTRGRIAIVPVGHGGDTVYRARLIGLSRSGAQDACRALERRQTPCQVVAPGDAETIAAARQERG